MSNKTYLLNNEEVDECGNKINNNDHKSKKIISLVAAFGLTSLLATGAYLGINSGIFSLSPEPTVIATVTQATNNYDVIYSNGIHESVSEYDIREAITGHDIICVNGEYYSNLDEIMVVTTRTKYTKTIKPTQEITYVAPEGYVLVGDKAIKAEYVSPAKAIEDNEGNIKYVAPEGYVLVGDKAIKEEHYTKMIAANKNIKYVAPVGYILKDGKATKQITETTTYLLTITDYINNFNEIVGKVNNYSATLVRPKPLSELYNLIGINTDYTYKKN